MRFTVDPRSRRRAGFTPEELGTVGVRDGGGRAGAAPVLVNDRPYTLRVRFPASARASLEAMSNTMLVSSTGDRDARVAGTTVDELPGQTEIRRENLQRLVEVTARLEGVDLGTGIAAVQKAVADLKLPPSIRVEYGGTYEEQQKSFRDLVIVLVLAVVLIFLVLLFEFRSFTRAGRDPVVGAAVDVRRVPRAAGHADDVQPVVVHGPDHGDRHRREERHPAARRRTRSSARTGCQPEEAMIQAGRAPAAADRDDGAGGGGRHAAAGARRSAPARRCCSRWRSR